MKKFATLGYLLLLTNLIPEILKAQKNEINVLPARLYYDRFDDDLGFAYAFQYAEFERKLNNKFSVNFGAAFKSKRKESNDNLYKNQYLLFNSGIRYYMNKKNNMSGLYSGIGVLLEKYKERSTGNFDDFISTAKEFNGTQNYFGSEISSGYKYCFIKDRVSVDLSLRTRVLMYSNNIRETIYLDNSNNTFNNSSNNWGISVPFMDLRIGYRFGFKK
jgi:hypothetical protein